MFLYVRLKIKLMLVFPMSNNKLASSRTEYKNIDAFGVYHSVFRYTPQWCSKNSLDNAL